jgi:hypothetical protein
MKKPTYVCAHFREVAVLLKHDSMIQLANFSFALHPMCSGVERWNHCDGVRLWSRSLREVSADESHAADTPRGQL